jgi:hypothetical protein
VGRVFGGLRSSDLGSEHGPLFPRNLKISLPTLGRDQ